MKKIFLLIILNLLFIPNVNAKTYTEYKIGTEVKLSKGNEKAAKWTVIENSDSKTSYVKLLKYYDVNGLTAVRFDTNNNKNDYQNSSLKPLVDAYGSSLGLGSDLIEIGLINWQQLQTLGCVKENEKIDCSKSISWIYKDSQWTSIPSEWLYKGSYWTSIPVENTTDTIYHFSGNSILSTAKTTSTLKMAVRPVIAVKKESIAGNVSTNEKRDFNNIDIICDKELKSGQEFECIIKIDKEVQSMNFDLKIEGLSILDEYVFENATWNEDLEILGEYEKEGISLTKLSGQEDSEVLLKLSGITKELKEDSKIKFTFKNIKLYDEVGDYQEIDSIEKELTFLKEQKQELIENPKTGIGSIILILTILSIFGGLTYFVVNKYSKKSTL